MFTLDFPLSVRQFFALCFSDDAPLGSWHFHDARKETEVEVGGSFLSLALNEWDSQCGLVHRASVAALSSCGHMPI